MEKMLYEKIFNLENNHWWFQARTKIIFFILTNYIKITNDFKILDIGCGTGLMIKKIKNKFKNSQILGIDSSSEAVRFCKKRGLDIILASADKTNQTSSSFDLIMALDLIEHVKQDTNALKEFNRILKNNGYILITVPAFEFLFDIHDKLADHKRRYTTKKLKLKLKSTGFKIIKISYYNTFLFIPIIILKLFKKITGSNQDHIQKENFILNYLCKIIFSSEFFILKYFNFPFGVSIICLAQKNKIH